MKDRKRLPRSGNDSAQSHNTADYNHVFFSPQGDEGHYMELLQKLPVAAYTCDEMGYVRLFNDAAVTLWGRTPLAGTKWSGWFKVYTPEGKVVPMDETPMALTLKTKKSVLGQELIIERPDGSLRNIIPYPQLLINNSGEVEGAVNILIDITEQKKQEKTAKNNEHHYRQLINSLPAAVYTCDQHGYITEFNDAAASLWGRKPEIGKDLWCGSWRIYKTDGSDMPLDSCPMAIALKEQRPVYGAEIIVQREDGLKLNVLPHPRPLFDTNGKLTGAVNMLIDVTEFKHTQNLIESLREDAKRSLEQQVQERTQELIKKNQELRRSEERYHRMIAEVQDYAIVLLNKDGVIQNWNKGAEKIKGYKAEEIVGKNFRVFYTDRDRENQLPDYLINKAAVEGRATHEGWRVRKDGSTFWGSIVITALHDDFNNVVGFSKVTRDLTEKKAADDALKIYTHQMEVKNEELESRNEELRRSEERYHRMIDEVQDYAIVLLSKEGIIENWNKGAEKIKGYKANEIVGKSFKVFYTETDRNDKVPDRLLEQARTEGKANAEGWRVRKDGTRFWGNITLTALHDDENNVIGFSKVTRDLTEKKAAEDALHASALTLAEKNKALEAMNQELASFAYVSSHDLQEPLRKIQTFASRIAETEYETLSPKGKDYFIRMQNAALRMQTLIEDLLSYSRTNTAEQKFESTDMNKLLEDVKNDLKESIEEKHAVIKSSRLPKLNVITFQFRQLLTNILSNALKFSKESEPPRINISAEIVKGANVPQAVGTRLEEKDFHHIAIQDNGIGFEPEHKFKIFEVFQRLHGRSEYSGTGIGLAICKKIIENHGGFISADSELDQGATFHLYIPVTTA
jgi:PAS domain S-box-containing protein